MAIDTRDTKLFTCACCLIGLQFVAISHTIAGTFQADDSSEMRHIRNKIQAAQFLSNATFGPTEETIDALAVRIGQIGLRRACEQSIDDKFALPMTSQEQTCRDIIRIDGREPAQDRVGIQFYRYQAWWHIALTSEDQLRQRVAWSLAQIFAVGNSGAGFENMQTLLEHFDLLLCNGSMSESTKRMIYEGLATTDFDGPGQAIPRVEGMLLAVATSPDCAVQD